MVTSVACHGPAVTLKITNKNNIEYSVDLTLAIKDKSWPEDAEEWKRRDRKGIKRIIILVVKTLIIQSYKITELLCALSLVDRCV